MLENFIGWVLGERYQIKSMLGSGRTALVFSARDRKLDRQVAIKVVRPEYAWASDIIDLLIEEARVVAKLEHPNILSVYDQGAQTIEGQRLVYLVMQLAGGGTLADQLEVGFLTPRKVDGILKQVCDALDYAHSREVLHLDLKPLNILFGEQGNVLVADFGLAKLLRGASRVKADTGFGTPVYMPPEQYFGYKAGPFSDVYALGVTLYQMLTGELPEPDWTDPLLPLRLDHPLSPRIRPVIERATQSDPDQRYRTAGELAWAFSGAIAPSSPGVQGTEVGLDERDLHRLKGAEKILPAGKRAEDQTPVEDREDKRWGPSGMSMKRWGGIGAVVSLIVAVVSCVATTIVIPEVRQMLGLESSATPSVAATAGQTVTPAATPTLTPSPTATLTPTPSPTPCLVVSVDRLSIYAGPGEIYDVWGEVRRGDQLLLRGCLEDGTWWQVDYLGRKGWVRAQSVGANVEPTVLPAAEAPPTPITTPTPTEEAAPSLPAPNTVLGLQNPGFERVREKVIPGWSWRAVDNWPEEEYDPSTSFDTPFFGQPSDPTRMIDGATLQIEATAFLNLRVHVFQTVSVPPTLTIRFQASAKAYSNVGGIKLAVGIDPDGGPDCSQASWGDTLTIDQSSGIVQLVSPNVVVGRDGQVTVCLAAENVYPGRSNAAFFDNAALIANPE